MYSLLVAALGLLARKHGLDDRAHETSRKILLLDQAETGAVTLRCWPQRLEVVGGLARTTISPIPRLSQQFNLPLRPRLLNPQSKAYSSIQTRITATSTLTVSCQ